MLERRITAGLKGELGSGGHSSALNIITFQMSIPPTINCSITKKPKAHLLFMYLSLQQINCWSRWPALKNKNKRLSSQSRIWALQSVLSLCFFACLAVQTWMKTQKLKHLGVPRYWGSGLHEKGGKR